MNPGVKENQTDKLLFTYIVFITWQHKIPSNPKGGTINGHLSKQEKKWQKLDY